MPVTGASRAQAGIFYDKGGGKFNVKHPDFANGAKGDGVTDDRAAFAAADIACQAVNGAAIYVPASVSFYKIATSLTITSPIFFEDGALIQPSAGQTLTLNGRITAPTGTGQPIFGITGSVVIGYKTMKLYALWFSGADIGAKINAAINALGAGAQKGPGTIVVDGQSNGFATMINLDNSRSIRITSDAGNMNSVTDWGPNLIWTGGANSGPAVSCRGSVALEWDHVNLSYNNAAYDAKAAGVNSGLMTFIPPSPFVMNTGTPHIHHCRISGTPTAKLAARLIELGTTLGFTIDHCTLDYAVDGISCSANSCNQVDIGGGMWFDSHFSGKCIGMWGHGWVIHRTNAESVPTVGVPLTPFLRLDGDSSGLTVADGVFLIDGGTGGGTMIDLDQGGHTIWGVMISVVINHGSGIGIKLSNTAGATSGVAIQGCRIDGLATGVDLGKADGIVLEGNRLASTVPWTGSAPTRLKTGSNNCGAFAAACGISVLNNGVIDISLPGSGADLAGYFYIFEHTQSAHAMFNISGGGGAVTVRDNAGGSYTQTFGNALTINVYWNLATNSYRLQNLSGGTRLFIFNYIGR
jgi:hypothetical protein